jgi:hypothetical protein
MKTLSVSSFGPIKNGTVEFGDLTVLVGPQASGKSLFAQLFKAITDAAAIRKTLREYGYSWMKDADSSTRLKHYLSLFFGAGMQSIWKDGSTRIEVDGGGRFDFYEKVVASPNGDRAEESVFYIPAQRVLVLQDGWPSPLGRSAEAPYCMRVFSDVLRQVLDQPSLLSMKSISPDKLVWLEELGGMLNKAIYADGRLRIATSQLRKRLVIVPAGSNTPLPYSAWSAGQREFTPLLLGLYRLPGGRRVSKGFPIKTIVVEEPEAGLHPQAIISFCLAIFDLIACGYKVVVSTHSPVVLDIAWALREFKDVPSGIAIEALGEIFGLHRSNTAVRRVLAAALKKDCRVFYFDRLPRRGTFIRDISSLDPGDTDENVSGWGGVTGFSGRTADIVGNAIGRGRQHARRP